ncbi:MAG: DMT family transporter [Pseudomonadota bacterium]
MFQREYAVDYLLLLTIALIWSTSFLLIKVGVETIPPATLTSGRLIVAAVLLVGFLIYKGEKLLTTPSALLLYSVVGVFGNSLPFILISWGELSVDSSLAAILMGIMPILTFVLAHFFIPSESMTLRKVIGVCFGFAGLVTLVGLSALQGFNDRVVGQLVILAAASSYAFTTIFVRSRPAFSGTQMATGATIAGAVTSLPVAFLFESVNPATVSNQSLIALLILAVGPTAIAALIYFRVIHRLGATTFSQINYLVPVLGSIWGVVFLSEILHWRMIVALVMVLFGIFLIQLPAGALRRNNGE